MTAVATRPVAVEELQRAWRAVQAGQFRSPNPAGQRSRPTQEAATTWAPTGTVLPVIGCIGQAGASTVALALASAAGTGRVVECCSATRTGLTTAVTAELGHTATGWRLGRREQVEILRAGAVHCSVADVPAPDPPAGPEPVVTVLDVGWDLGQVLATPGWVERQVTTAEQLVLVTTTSVPGIRSLEVAATVLGPRRCVAVVVGARRRWRPPPVATGPTIRALVDSGHLMPAATEKALAHDGLTAAPLPPALLRTAAGILHRCGVTTPDTSPQKGPLP
jgi:hypothetical protein